MKPRDLFKRIEALEGKVRSTAPFRKPKTHKVFGSTTQERDAAMHSMIGAGEADADDIFFLIVPANDESVRKA